MKIASTNLNWVLRLVIFVWSAHLAGVAGADEPEPVRTGLVVEPLAANHNTARAIDNQPPNIVVIMGDDWSWPHAGSLGDNVVSTPTFDRLAKEGVLFENAFSTSPSCTSSRFAFATGQYQWRLGSGMNLGGSLPAGIPVYPELLADKGYVIGFSRKGAEPSKQLFRQSDPFGARFKNFDTFMESIKANSLDSSSRGSKASEPQSAGANHRPFCFWYGAGEPHRPYPWKASMDSTIDLDAIKIPKSLPHNETVKTDLGDYYLRIQKLDLLAGKIVQRLESEGILDNTILVMTGDNGMPFPRCKATLYDNGTRVPLAIRWGSRIKPGRTVSDFVTLTDLAPTFLEACNPRTSQGEDSRLAIPKVMTGRSLMPQLLATDSGQIEADRLSVLTGRERHVYQQPARAIRTSKFLYIRNFDPLGWPTGVTEGPQPHYDFSELPWPTKPPAFSFDVDPSPTKQWMLEHAESDGDLDINALAFGVRPEEELYDLLRDPDQIHNVVDEPGYRANRDELSQRLVDGLSKSVDPKFQLKTHASFRIRGWRVHLHHQLWQDSPAATKRMLQLMSGQLERVANVVPPVALKRLRAVPIWINPTYEGVPPTGEYHGSATWLKRNNRDVAMAKSIEITNVDRFTFENTRMPYLMLHELAHAYHDQVLGFRHAKIRTTFESAKANGGYDSVKRFNGRKIIQDTAYAISNEKEYFAESTEAYFGKNDFFPFNRSELKDHDPAMHDLVAEVWGAVKNTD